ncbi:MAG TPA: MBL fold metallo-hydrolase [Candidatus Omnitrophota bacterium]|nr:MBL fold metallo-hydrolase [Candidatus Omnitrophota bacterium]HNQ50396.1 MBL fold metallo-hydrolase [Candidatus Omnitrophota bacterium]HQO37708.1 MBL fold metallo-hydrolase [Candidatus Omnitrophota bacterium]HQQ05949.1 MBL fold metallo-hydrolase [Candidatus Omnitrophota bacterium]
MNIKIIAVGSSKWDRFIRRWGVSFLIGDDVLFDTFGAGRVLSRNVRKLNIDIARIKHIVLSHDDWDHISGLWELIPGRTDITVYICPGFKQEIKGRILSSGAKLVEVHGVMKIKEGVYSTGELTGQAHDEPIYEQSVVIKTSLGLALVCGCAHPGVANIVRHVQERFCENVSTLIGGFHMKDNSGQDNRCIIIDLRELGVRRIVPMHCTGTAATKMMRKEFGSDCIKAGEGKGIEV